MNISKSGIGFSVGPRGASLSFGPNGAYSNVGIPGTGISFRNKLSQGQRVEGREETRPGNRTSVNVRVHIDDDGQETISATLVDGTPIKDETDLNRIKRNPDVKALVQKCRQGFVDEVNEKSSNLIDIVKHSADPTNWDDVKKSIDAIQQHHYEKRSFLEEKPDLIQAEFEVRKEAEKECANVRFFRNKAIQNYVEEHKESKLKELCSVWEKRKQDFDANELKIAIEKDEEYAKEANEKRHYITKIFSPDKTFLENRLDDILSGVELPMDFDVSYEISNDLQTISLDIDLPEIETITTKKASILASGKISLRNKTTKELNREYFAIASGLMFYFASIAFSVSPVVENVTASGFTQRINRATGNMQNDYVLSVNFSSSEFANLNLKNIDPTMAIEQFNHLLNLTDSFEMKKIVL